MSEEHDRQFIHTFSMVLVGLVAFAIIIIGLSLVIHNRHQDIEPSAAREAAKVARLRPVAGVYTEASQAAAAQEEQVEEDADDGPALAFDGSMDGEMIYARVCAVCHDAGVAGAPRLVAADWEARLDKGREKLIANAINGINAMPARGGRADLGDEQVAASVDYMLDQLD